MDAKSNQKLYGVGGWQAADSRKVVVGSFGGIREETGNDSSTRKS